MERRHARGGAATSYPFLLVTRVALGGVTATANPTIASLIGDYFDAADRGRIYGMILAGELVGTGFGFLLSGFVGEVSWRWAFWMLALPGAFVAWLVWRRLPEPARAGAKQLTPEASVSGGGGSGGAPGEGKEGGGEAARRVAREQGIQPDPTGSRPRWSWWPAWAGSRASTPGAARATCSSGRGGSTAASSWAS